MRGKKNSPLNFQPRTGALEDNLLRIDKYSDTIGFDNLIKNIRLNLTTPQWGALVASIEALMIVSPQEYAKIVNDNNALFGAFQQTFFISLCNKLGLKNRPTTKTDMQGENILSAIFLHFQTELLPIWPKVEPAVRADFKQMNKSFYEHNEAQKFWRELINIEKNI